MTGIHFTALTSSHSFYMIIEEVLKGSSFTVAVTAGLGKSENLEDSLKCIFLLKNTMIEYYRNVREITGLYISHSITYHVWNNTFYPLFKACLISG